MRKEQTTIDALEDARERLVQALCTYDLTEAQQDRLDLIVANLGAFVEEIEEV